MIRIYEENKRKFIKIKEFLYPVIYDKKSECYMTLYMDTILHITKDGQVVKKITLNQNTKVFNDADICHRQTYFLDNGRKCAGCERIIYCQCLHNIDGHFLMQYLHAHGKIDFYKIENVPVEKVYYQKKDD
jgi:hypothetical protein